MRSVTAENSGDVSGTVKYSQYESAVVERLEDDQVISVCAKGGVRAHSLRAFFDHFGVLAFQTVKYLGGGFRFAAAATPFDFATQTVDYRLATLLVFFQKSQPIPNDLTSGINQHHDFQIAA